MNWHCTVSAGLGARCKGVQLWTVNYGNVARKIDRDLGAARARREQQDTSSFPEVPACGSTYSNAPVRAIGSAVIGYATEIAVGGCNTPGPDVSARGNFRMRTRTTLHSNGRRRRETGEGECALPAT